MNQSQRDLFRILCAVALTGGVAACDAPSDEDRIGPEDFRTSGSLDRAEGATTAPGHGGGLEPRGDYRLGTDLEPEGELGAPMGETGAHPQVAGDQAGTLRVDEQSEAPELEGRRGMPADEDAETVSDVPGAGVSGRAERSPDPERGGAIGEVGAGEGATPE